MGRVVTTMMLLVVASLSGDGLALAEREDHDRARQMRDAGEILPLEEILSRSRQRVPGRILEIEMEREHGRVLYELKILDEKGAVWELKVDASNGEILKMEREILKMERE